MLKIFGFVALLSIATGFRIGGKIVGGEDADIKDFPYQLSLQHRGYHSCGASLIAPNIALTAAHCTDGRLASFLSVRAGSSFEDRGGTLVKVNKFIEHPKFRFPDYDLSILFLSQSLPVGEPGYAVIPLVEEGGPPAADTKVIVSGWGDTASGGNPPDQLQKVEVNVFDMDTCRSIYGRIITDRLFCAGIAEGGKDSCQGDSGGPIVLNGVLIGAVSGGESCALPNYPGYYASISNMRQWINDTAHV